LIEKDGKEGLLFQAGSKPEVLLVLCPTMEYKVPFHRTDRLNNIHSVNLLSGGRSSQGDPQSFPIFSDQRDRLFFSDYKSGRKLVNPFLSSRG